MEQLIKLVEKKSKSLDFKSGDTISVHIKIIEGNKQRIQKFQGVVLRRKNIGTNNETFTVRKVSNDIGVEKIFLMISPSIEKIEITRRGKVRRARLYYLRNKQGKSAYIKEKRLFGNKKLKQSPEVTHNAEDNYSQKQLQTQGNIADKSTENSPNLKEEQATKKNENNSDSIPELNNKE